MKYRFASSVDTTNSATINVNHRGKLETRQLAVSPFGNMIGKLKILMNTKEYQTARSK